MFQICPTNPTKNIPQTDPNPVAGKTFHLCLPSPPQPTRNNISPSLHPGWSQAGLAAERRSEFNYIALVEVRGKLSSASWLILIIIYPAPPPAPPPSPNPTLQHFHKDTGSSRVHRIQAIVATPTCPRQNILISGRKSIWDLEEMIILDLKYRLIIKIASPRDFISAIQVRTNQFRSFQLVKLLFTLCFRFLLRPQV